MSYQGLARTVEIQLTSSEWDLVAYYVLKADDLGSAGKDAEARRALEDAIYVAKSNGEDNIVIKLDKYIGFY